MSDKKKNYNRSKRFKKAANMNELNNLIEKFNNHNNNYIDTDFSKQEDKP